MAVCMHNIYMYTQTLCSIIQRVLDARVSELENEVRLRGERLADTTQQMTAAHDNLQVYIYVHVYTLYMYIIYYMYMYNTSYIYFMIAFFGIGVFTCTCICYTCRSTLYFSKPLMLQSLFF